MPRWGHQEERDLAIFRNYGHYNNNVCTISFVGGPTHVEKLNNVVSVFITSSGGT